MRLRRRSAAFSVLAFMVIIYIYRQRDDPRHADVIRRPERPLAAQATYENVRAW